MENTTVKSEIQEKKEDTPDDYFIWQDYLDATNSKEVPQILFGHVEQSLQSGFQEGMKVQVPLKDDLNNYWVATIIAACGPLLSLRYVGDKDDRSKDFWSDMSKMELRPLGWAESNGKILVPPAHLNEIISHKDLKSMLRSARTISQDLIKADGFTPVDRIKPGMKVEVQDRLHPYHVWIATIVENVGGRLLLRYDCPGNSAPKDFWVFYSSPRIFFVGWVESRGAPWKYVRPSCCKNSTNNESAWESVLKTSKEDAQKLPLSADVFKCFCEKTVKHNFSVGMKLEAVHPQNKAEVCPASIVQIFDDTYFLVELDDMTQKKKNEDSQLSSEEENDELRLTWLASASHPYIFRCGWAKKNSVKLTHPRGWISEKEEFDWKEYLEKTHSVAANIPLHTNLPPKASEQGFELAMKLEVVNPDNENQICAASITYMTNHILWIHLDSSDCFQPSIMFSTDSKEMFPVGWCEMNNYPLKPPKSFQPASTQPVESPSSTLPEERASQGEKNPKADDRPSSSSKETSKTNGEAKGSSWCPKIYFNHKCFTGPLLSKGKLAQLPKAIGPGPVTLVMKEVLSLLISIAYISSRVLRELSCRTKPKPNMHLEVLKAKYKANTYRASVEIITSADKVNDFCKEICNKLQVCPYLFGPVAVGEKSCPENCSTLSKTRFCKNRNTTYNSSGNNNNSNNTENSVTLVKKDTTYPNRKLFGWPRKRRILEREIFPGCTKVSNESDSVPEKRTRYETRGVKLPNFGLKKSNGSGNKHTSSASETSSIASTQNEPPTCPVPKKRGRYSKAKKEELRKAAERLEAAAAKERSSSYEVDSNDSNPLLWTIEDVYDYLKGTDDCDILAGLLKEEEFDGKSFMLLNLPSCLDGLKLSTNTALNLCRHVEVVKYTFFQKYVIPTRGSVTMNQTTNNNR